MKRLKIFEWVWIRNVFHIFCHEKSQQREIMKRAENYTTKNQEDENRRQDERQKKTKIMKNERIYVMSSLWLHQWFVEPQQVQPQAVSRRRYISFGLHILRNYLLLFTVTPPFPTWLTKTNLAVYSFQSFPRCVLILAMRVMVTHTKELFLHAGKKLQQAASAYSLLNLDSLMNLTSLAGAFQDETCVVTCVVTWHCWIVWSYSRSLLIS